MIGLCWGSSPGVSGSVAICFGPSPETLSEDPVLPHTLPLGRLEPFRRCRAACSKGSGLSLPVGVRGA